MKIIRPKYAISEFWQIEGLTLVFCNISSKKLFFFRETVQLCPQLPKYAQNMDKYSGNKNKFNVDFETVNALTLLSLQNFNLNLKRKIA